MTKLASVKSPLANLFKTPMPEILNGITDWHSHILPGVDDGFRTLDDSLAALAEYEKAGVRSVWLTPHIMEDMPNETADLKTAYEELKRAYCGPVMVYLASENMLDFLFERRLEEKDLLPLSGRRLLIETSYYNPPSNFNQILGKIRSAGYFPVLAHPERYMYMDEKQYRQLHSSGVKFQLNIPSLTGFYGSEVRSRAENLLENGLYDLTGTDTHRLRDFLSLLDTSLSRKYADALSGR